MQYEDLAIAGTQSAHGQQGLSYAGIAEFVTHGISAECYEFGAAGLRTAIQRILDDPLHAHRLATGGRQAMLERWETASFPRIWESMVR